MSAAEHYPFPEDEVNALTAPEAPAVTFPARETFIRRSETFGEITKALAKAQLSFQPIIKKVENTFYTTDKKKAMYADLAAVIAATQKALAENGLIVIQSPIVKPETKEAGTRSLLSHSSGEWLENEILLPATAKFKEYAGNTFIWKLKFDAQTIGIAITYSRRYSYQSIIGVAAEEDDDANGIGQAAEPGSTKAAMTVGARKVEEIKKQMEAAKPQKEACLFYSWSDEEQKGYVTGDRDLLMAAKELLYSKAAWDSKAKAFRTDAEGLEALKYEFEQRKVNFRPLKAS